MPAGSRRKRVVESSDSEGGPATSLNTSHGDTSKKQQDADIGAAGSESESEVVLSQSAKRQKLEAQPAPQVRGGRQAKAKALSNAVWLNAGAPTGKGAPWKGIAGSRAASKTERGATIPTTKATELKPTGRRAPQAPKSLDNDNIESSDNEVAVRTSGRQRPANEKVFREHPTNPARGLGPTKRSNVQDDHGFSEDEMPNLDTGWNSDARAADISDPEESCNEDAAAEVPESDDPELAHAGPTLSAKLSAERPTWVNAKQDKAAGAPVSHTSSKHARHALKSISNSARAQAKPTHDVTRALPESKSQISRQDVEKRTGTLDDASNALPAGQAQPDAVEQRWPSYTNLVWSSNGEVNLTSQTFEVKAVVRKAIPLILSNLMFVNGYPDHPTRSAWGRKALISAAIDMKIALERNSQAASVHYNIIRQRLKRQDDYWPHLARLLDGRVSIFRNNLKATASQASKLHYGLTAGCAREVEFYLSKMRYIYPCDVKTQKVDVQRPYQHPAIISVLSLHYFTRSSAIIRDHQQEFQPTDEAFTDNEAPDAMIASSATAVYAGVTEWRSGTQQHHAFSANSFADVYQAHRSLLAGILRGNPRAYHALKARLYRLAQDAQMPTSVSPADADALHDVQNLTVD